MVQWSKGRCECVEEKAPLTVGSLERPKGETANYTPRWEKKLHVGGGVSSPIERNTGVVFLKLERVDIGMNCSVRRRGGGCPKETSRPW